jgi:hypothetical protein
LETFLSVEGDKACLHFSFLCAKLRRCKRSIEKSDTYFDVDFVTTQHDGDVLADSLKITMPVWNVFVCDSRSNVKHDDPALALNIVTIAKTTKLLLASSVPNVEADGTKIGGEGEGMNFDTQGG